MKHATSQSKNMRLFDPEDEPDPGEHLDPDEELTPGDEEDMVITAYGSACSSGGGGAASLALLLTLMLCGTRPFAVDVRSRT